MGATDRPTGEYSVLANLEGFDAVEARQRVPLGGEAQVRLQLGLAAFEGDTVQVVAETPLLDQTGSVPPSVDTCQRPASTSGNGRTYTSPRPDSSEAYASHRPSGENSGVISLAAVWITGRVLRSAIDNTQISKLKNCERPVESPSSTKASAVPSGDQLGLESCSS